MSVFHFHARRVAPTLRSRIARCLSKLALSSFIALASLTSAEALERLRAGAVNPRYFADASGKAVYLAGSYQNPYNLLSGGAQDFSLYLDFLVQRNHNFTRLWAWEQSPWSYGPDGQIVFTAQPYERTGPGAALDGGLKFDLTRFNEAYFEQLRNRIIAARQRGIYVSLIVFEGFSSQRRVRQVNPWLADPFQRNNNINGVDADPNRNGSGEEFFSLNYPALTSLQEAFLRKLVDTVNDLDNVLYEVSGDTLATSLAWQYHMIDYLKSYQAAKPNQHPVGISQFYTKQLAAISNSQADWIVHMAADLAPPVANSNKIIVLEGSPALFRTGSADQWPWKAFARGYNPIYPESASVHPDIEERVQAALGQTRAYSQLLNLASMFPSTTACSTGFCLTNRATDYLVYLPTGGQVSVDLSASNATYVTSWFSPIAGQTAPGNNVAGGKQTFASPVRGQIVLQILSALTPLGQANGRTANQAPGSTGNNATDISSPGAVQDMVDTPEMTPNGGVYSGSVKVALKTATRGATIYYTTNGQSPTPSSKRYSSAFNLSGSTLVKAKAFKSNMAPSAEASAWFSNSDHAGAGAFSYSLSNSGNMSVTAGSAASTTIVAKLDSGNARTVQWAVSGLPAGATASLSATSCTPTCSSTLTISTSSSTPAGNYPVTVTGTAEGATKTTSFNLGVAAALTVATPTITPNGGTFTGSVSVIMATTTAGASIYYTTDGTTPTQSSTLYAKPISLTGSAVIKAKAFRTSYLPSGEASAVFTRDSGNSGLVAHWRFDEGSGTAVADSSGNGNSGTLINGPLWSAGRIGKALYFDGIDDSVTMLNSASLNLSRSFTLSAWVKPATTFNDFRSILVKNYKYYLYASVVGHCGDGNPLGGFDGGTLQVVCDDAAPLSIDSWTHLVLVSNGSTLTLYRDGVAVANTNSSAALSSSTGTLQIGASQWGEYFKGLIDEVRVYNRVLDGAEVQAIYQQESVEESQIVAAPIISPNGGSYNGSVPLTLQTATSGASIHYTTNGSTPTQSSTLYTGALTLTSGAAVKAKAFKSGLNASPEASAFFSITQPFAFSAANSGNKSVVAGSSISNSIALSLISGGSQSVSFSVSGLPSGASGSFSTGSCSPACSTLLNISTNGSTPAGDFPITVTASGGGVTRTTVFTLSVTLALTVATPTITPNGGAFSDSASIAIQTTTSGASIYYTTNGSTPTQSSNLYTGALTITSGATVNAKAFKSGSNPSATASASFAVSNTTGNVYYVANSGNDSVSCTTARNIATPKRSVNQALSCLQAGDTLYIRSGTYTERVIIRSVFGTASKPVTISGYPGDSRPIFRPGANSEPYVWIVDYDVPQTARYITIRSIEIDDINYSGEAAACMYLGTPQVTVENVILKNCSGNGFQLFSSNLTVRNSQVLACGRIQGLDKADAKGIGFYISPPAPANVNPNAYARDNLWENNVVDGCRGGGGVIHYGRSDNNIVRNSIFKNAGDYSPWPWPAGATGFRSASGINLGGAGFFNGNTGPRFNKIYNNLFLNLKHKDVGAGHFLWGAQENTIVNNTYYNVDVLYQITCGFGNDGYVIQNNIVAEAAWGRLDTGCTEALNGTVSNNLLNPDLASTFIDAKNGDFHLRASSSAVSSGQGATLP